MIEKSYKIKRWISEESESLDALVAKAIKQKSRIHIKAPVHTGKTTFAIDQIVNRRKEQQLLVLAPQIAITTHIFNELHKKGVQAFIFNGETKDEFSEDDLNHPILSTIDSAHLFFDGTFTHQLDPAKVLVIIDESHAFIQDGKEDYDKTVRALLGADVPIIGFSATPSAWVIEHLLKVDESIEFEVTDLKPKEILSVEIEKNLNASAAHAIKIEGFKKVVIFTSNVTDQDRIEQEIHAVLPEMKCLVLNRPNRLTDEQQSWDYLMKNGTLPSGTDVLLMNKVAQAGININDKDIDAVFLVGHLDPIGFLQYLGRCRNYTGKFYYLYGNFGKKEIEITGADEHENYQILMQQAINLFAKAENLSNEDVKGLFQDAYTISPEGDILLNKCILAKKRYDNFRGLRGDVLIDFMKKFDPTLILGGDYIFEGIESSINKDKQQGRRNKLKKEVAEAIANNATYILPMIKHMKEKITYSDAIDLVTKSSKNEAQATKKNVLYLPDVQKLDILEMLVHAKEVGIGVPKLLVASKKYIDGNNDSKAIDNVLKMSNAKIVRTVKAYLFYEQNLANNTVVKSILDDLEKKVGEKKTSDDWRSWISNKVGKLPGSEYLTVNIMYSCCIMKAVQIQSDGKKFKRRKLEKVIRTYKDYVKENNLDNIF